MTLRYYANAPATTLASGCTSSATSITVSSTTGMPLQFPYTLILDYGASAEEVVTVLTASGPVLTVTRGADGSSTFAHSSGAVVVHGISAQDPREANAHVNATGGVHGLAGGLVGTTDTQALINKDLTSGTNTFPAALATDAEVAAAIASHSALTTGVHGAGSGELLTTTGTQTLTNKTIDGSNSIVGLPPSQFAKTDATGKLGTVALTLPTSGLVGVDDAQILNNKQLFAPQLYSPLIDGVDIGAHWTTYTPNLNGMTLGNGTVSAAWRNLGRIVNVRILITLGSTSTVTGPITMNAPEAVIFPAPVVLLGVARDISAGVSYPLVGEFGVSDQLHFTVRYLDNSPVRYLSATTTTPFTWASGDYLYFNGSYEDV